MALDPGAKVSSTTGDLGAMLTGKQPVPRSGAGTVGGTLPARRKLTPAQLNALALKAAAKYGISATWIKAIVMTEAPSLQADVRGDNGQSYGLAQIYKAGQRGYPTVAQATNPDFAVDYIAKRMADFKKRYPKAPPEAVLLQHNNPSAAKALALGQIDVATANKRSGTGRYVTDVMSKVGPTFKSGAPQAPGAGRGGTATGAGEQATATGGVNPGLDARIQALIAAAPGKVTINSSFRTRAQQQKLYDDYIAGRGNLAAKPGSSNHEKGLAFDLGYANADTKKWVLANASRFGLHFPIPSEPWHAEPVETRGAALSPEAVKAGIQPLSLDAATTVGGVAGDLLASDPTSLLGPDGKVDAGKALEKYGFIAELANSQPEIKKKLEQAINEGWEPTRFAAEIQTTQWWKTKNEVTRRVDILKKTDPAEYKRQRQQMIDKMVITARNLGVNEGSQRIFILAERALSLGWSDQEVERYLAADVKVADPNNAKATNTGQTAVTVDSLKEQAAQYGVPMSQQTLQTWTTQVLRGMVPMESFQSYLKEQAKSLFPGLAKAIDAGVTVEQYTNPYRELIAQTLEVNPQSITMTDPRVQRALYNVTKGGDRTQMSLSEFQEYLRNTPDYAKTRQASETAASFTSRLTEMFGATA